MPDSPYSRYQSCAQRTIRLSPGVQIDYLERRFPPPPLATFQKVIAGAGPYSRRLDQLAYLHLQHPELSWRIGDQNPSRRLDDLERDHRSLEIPTNPAFGD